jgi:hypothetical protein
MNKNDEDGEDKDLVNESYQRIMEKVFSVDLLTILYYFVKDK